MAEAAAKQGGAGGKRTEAGVATVGKVEGGGDARVSAWLGGILEGGDDDVPVVVQVDNQWFRV